MWLGKFLDLEEDMKDLRLKIEKQIFTNIKKNKLTPLEFTIIETIFNNQQISGYDLIRILNDHFAGTWEAQHTKGKARSRPQDETGQIEIGGQIDDPVSDGKNIWLLDRASGELVKVDPSQQSEPMRFSYDGEISSLAFGGKSLWALQSEPFAILKIDPSSGEVLSTIDLDLCDTCLDNQLDTLKMSISLAENYPFQTFGQLLVGNPNFLLIITVYGL